MNCIFCDIIAGKAHAEVLYEDESVISFLDIRPVNYGHTLVIPKAHYENFLAVEKKDLESLIVVTQKISSAIAKSINPDGFNIVANNGIAAGQTVFHFHLHIIPRFSHDDFNFDLNLKSYSDGAMNKFANKIRSEISK